MKTRTDLRSHRISRRAFAKTTAAGLTALSTSRVLGAKAPKSVYSLGMGGLTVSLLGCPVDMNRRTFNAERPTLNIQLSASLDVES